MKECIAKIVKEPKTNYQNTDFSYIKMKDLSPGETFLGCIDQVGDYELRVHLPHQIFGFVPVTNISQSYTNLLSLTASEDDSNGTEALLLTELYQTGQFVVVQVVSIIKTEKSQKVILTMDPKMVNKALCAVPLSKGKILQCAVTESEENGYVIETGLPWVRGAFLSKKKAERKYDIGSVFLAAIHSSKKLAVNDDNCRYNIKVSTVCKDLEVAHCEQIALFPGTLMSVLIQKVHKNGLEVKSAVGNGIIHSTHLVKPFEKSSNYVQGASINARVLYKTPLTNVIHFSVHPVINTLGHVKFGRLDDGTVVKDCVITFSSDSRICLALPNDQFGFCTSRDLTDDKRVFSKSFSVGKKKTCRILKFWLLDQIYQVSCKQSVIELKAFSIQDLKIGEFYDLIITEQGDSGAVVSICNKVKGFIPKIHIPRTKKILQIGSTVQGRLFLIKNGSSPYVTIREELLQQKDAVTEITKVGVKLGGIVFGKNEKGLHIEYYDGAKGFLSLSDVDSDLLGEYNSYKVGSFIQCTVKKLWSSKNVCLELLGEKKFSKKRKSEEIVSTQEPTNLKRTELARKRPKLAVSGNNESVDDTEYTKQTKSVLSVQSNGFVWNVSNMLNRIDDQDSSSEDELSKKKVQKHKKELQESRELEEEKMLRQKEASRLDPATKPQSAEEYELLLQKDPNCSLNWIQFMCYYLENSQYSKAIALGKRALTSIDITKEQERLNIWNVLVKTELKYGTKSSYDAMYNDAIRCNDALKIYPLIADNLAQEEQIEEAKTLLKKFLKKNSKNKQAWLSTLEFYFRNEQFEEARELLTKAVLSLPTKDHIEFSSKYGLLEFRLGDAEKGKTVFEKILSNFPKRLDIWLVYKDALLIHGDIDTARHVLQRCSELGLKFNKLTSIFMSMRNLEKKYGTEATVAAVNRKIAEFVHSLEK